MPIIEIDVVPRPDEITGGRATNAAANKLGDVLNSNPGQTWIKLRALEPKEYAENGMGSRHDVYPIFISLLIAKESSEDELNKDTLRLGYVKSEEKRFKICTKDENQKFLSA